jgi:hypothetical protein
MSNTCFFYFQDSKCGACERDRAATMLQMYGQPYHPNTLKTVPPDDQATFNRVSRFTGPWTNCMAGLNLFTVVIVAE